MAMKEEIEEAGKSNERGKQHKKEEYPQVTPIFEEHIDGKIVRGFSFRSDAVAWAVHNSPTLAFYHSGVWEVLGLDDDGFEDIRSLTGSAFEKQARQHILSKHQIRI